MTLATNGSHPAPASITAPPPDWIQEHPNPLVHEVLGVLGHLLSGTQPQVPQEGVSAFAARSLGLPRNAPTAAETLDLTSTTRVTHGLVLADLIAEHDAETGPYEAPTAPSWTIEKLSEDTDLRLPHRLSAAFPEGTLHAEAPVVLRFSGRRSGFDALELEAVTRPGDRAAALEVLQTIRRLAEDRNPYRGRWLRVTTSPAGKTSLLVETAPDIAREDVIADAATWAEMDLATASVASGHRQLQDASLPTKPGVLVAGPPGVGKSQLCRAVAAELHRQDGFSVLYADALTGEHALAAVVRQAKSLTPAVLVLEDVDLFIHDRRAGGGGLSGLLEALDTPVDRLLIMATTNDSRALDRAAVRSGRIGVKVTVDYPNRVEVERILTRFLREIPGGDEVDVAAVAGWVPAQTSGADIKEILRRAVLGGPVTTDSLGAVIRSKRWRPDQGETTDGSYL